MGVVDERSGSKAHRGDGARAIGLESAWWRWETSGCARIDTVGWQMSIWARKGMVGVVDEQSGSKGHGQGWETSVQISDWVQECVVEVGHKRSGSN